MRFIQMAAIGIIFSLFGYKISAESLSDIYQLALKNDSQLRAEKAKYKAQKEQKYVALAPLLPQINAVYRLQNQDSTTVRESINFSSNGSLVAVDTTTKTDIEIDGYEFRVDQALFDLSAWFTFAAGKQLSKQAEATFAANQQNLITRVVVAYLEVLRSKDNLAASRAQERAFIKQLEQSQQRFEVGLIAVTDVYEASAARDLAEVNRIIDQNDVAVALEQLSVLTDKPHNELHTLKEDFNASPPDPIDRAQWVEFALRNNFSLRASQAAEEAARQNSRAFRSKHSPVVRGTYNYSDYDLTGNLLRTPATGFDTRPDQIEETESWMIEFSVPLSTGGLISANRRRAAQEFNAARQDRINLTRNTIANTRSLHMTVVSDVSRVKARKQSIISSKSALDATQAGYEVGTRNVVDVLNAQNALFAAKRDYANSRYDYISNLLRLKEQAGLLTPDDIFSLDGHLQPIGPVTLSSQ
ncbi:MAG: TolC family outer membrane protein [Halieaceae bacterium]|nr:TolC family outer membrane protein [Halieaceae bacterium]